MKIIILAILISFLALALPACSNRVITYGNSGTIIKLDARRADLAPYFPNETKADLYIGIIEKVFIPADANKYDVIIYSDGAQVKAGYIKVPLEGCWILAFRGINSGGNRNLVGALRCEYHGGKYEISR